MQFLLLVIAFLSFNTAHAQGIQQLQQIVSTSSPFNALTTLTAGKSLYLPFGAATTSSLAVRTLSNCDTIDTDINGNFRCGTDATGGGGGGASFGQTFEISGGYLAPTSTITVRLPQGFISIGSSTLTGNATTTGTHGVGALYINGERFTDLTGTGLTLSGGALNVSGLTTTQFTSANISQWTNNSNYIALTNLSASAPIRYNGSTGAFDFTGLSTTSQPTSSNLLTSNGGAGVYGTATTTASCSGTVACTPFTVLGSSPITLTGSGGGSGIGTIATSTSETAGQLAVFHTTNGYPATQYSIATGTVSCSGGATCSSFTVVGSGSTISVSNLTTINFASQNISQWTNDSGYITKPSLSASAPLRYNSSTGSFDFTGLATEVVPLFGTGG